MDTALKNLIIGACLAIFGGVIGQLFKMRLEKRQERKFIKLGLIDELNEICSTIDRLKETFEKTGLAHKSYLTDLLLNMDAYKHHRRRLFILEGEKFRHKIISFYKKLNEHITDSEGKVGTLADSVESKAEQREIVTKLQTFSTEANEIKTTLSSKVLYFF